MSRQHPAGWFAFLPFVQLLCGCSDEGSTTGNTAPNTVAFAPDATCALSMRLSGAVTATLSPETPTTCLSEHSAGSGMDVFYAPSGVAGVTGVEIRVDDVPRAEIGGPFGATVGVAVPRDPSRTDLPKGPDPFAAHLCTVQITEHSPTDPAGAGPDYRVVGRGTCSAPAESGTNGRASIAPFAFLTTITWDP